MSNIFQATMQWCTHVFHGQEWQAAPEPGPGAWTEWAARLVSEQWAGALAVTDFPQQFQQHVSVDVKLWSVKCLTC